MYVSFQFEGHRLENYYVMDVWEGGGENVNVG
jgi:hypothetical protein